MLFAASNGGHLAQLYELAGRIGGSAAGRVWVSFDCEQSRTLLEREEKIFVPYIAERDVGGVLRVAREARKIMGARPSIDTVVSTGSGIALAFLPYAAARGIAAHYIESAARVSRPSLTGRLVQHIPGISLYRQYPHVARGRWKFGGSVFDGFEATQGGPTKVRRVLVTVGTDKPFRRLIEAVAAILPDDVEVLWQTGHTPLDGLALEGRPFVPTSLLEQAAKRADVVVAHAGCGSVLMALAAGKCPVLVARNPDCGEVVDSHQIEIARWMSERGLAICKQPGDLSFADLELAASRAVVRSSDLAPFQLRRSQ
jgi:UDP-N-acetylglucosamine transferase subunit ALG13